MTTKLPRIIIVNEHTGDLSSSSQMGWLLCGVVNKVFLNVSNRVERSLFFFP